MYGVGTDGGEKCTCGHFANEHLWIPVRVPNWHESLMEDSPGPGRGLCKKCTCPKYDHQSRFVADESIKYPERVIKNDDSKKRCTRCGRLLSNHVDVGHPFQDVKI